jgi:4-hydroxybenzoate polyprenyltransferase
VSRPVFELLAYLRLMRLPNVFTALADVAMGFAFTRDWQTPFESSDGLLLACLAAASALLYTAGMVLNDVFDVEIDRKERPSRPLPSGRIPLATARALGFAMLAVGVILGWIAGFAYSPNFAGAIPYRAGLVATLLAVLIVLYNTFFKHTPLGPLAMGGCRFLNVLLGMSVAATGDFQPLGYDTAELLAAGGIGAYVAGITWFARGEADESSRLTLAWGVFVMIGGIALLGASLKLYTGPIRFPLLQVWLLLAILLFPTLRRAGKALVDPAPGPVQATVKHSILSLIVFDAAVCIAVAPTPYALAVLALMAPALLLGRWVYST